MTLYAPTDEALSQWESHWSRVGDMTPCVGTGIHSMMAPRYFLAPAKCFYDSAPFTVEMARLFCDRWSDVVRAEALAAEACRRLGWSGAEVGAPCVWSVVPQLAAPECFRAAQLWDELRASLCDRERHLQPWWDLWARAPNAVEKVGVQRRAWDELAARRQAIRVRRREVLPTTDANPFAPLVELYRLGVGFGRDDFGDTYTRLSLADEGATL